MFINQNYEICKANKENKLTSSEFKIGLPHAHILIVRGPFEIFKWKDQVWIHYKHAAEVEIAITETTDSENSLTIYISRFRITHYCHANTRRQWNMHLEII